MTDAALVGRLLRDYRLGGLDPGDVRHWSGSVSGTCVGYLVTVPGGARMAVQAFRGN